LKVSSAGPSEWIYYEVWTLVRMPSRLSLGFSAESNQIKNWVVFHPAIQLGIVVWTDKTFNQTSINFLRVSLRQRQHSYIPFKLFFSNLDMKPQMHLCIVNKSSSDLPKLQSCKTSSKIAKFWLSMSFPALQICGTFQKKLRGEY
jgi:hypothetical protein